MAKVKKAATMLILAAILVLGAGVEGCSYRLPLQKVDYRLSVPADARNYTQKEVEVRGSSLSPIILPGTELLLIEGYYKQRQAERYDVIAYHFAGNKSPIIKVVYGIPGDKWRLDDRGNFYRIIINDRAAKNANGVEYRIPKSDAKRLILYSNSYPTLPEDVYLILGNNPGGAVDSTLFGLVHRTDFIGKIAKKPARKKGKMEFR